MQGRPKVLPSIDRGLWDPQAASEDCYLLERGHLPGLSSRAGSPLDVRAQCQGTLWHCVRPAWHALPLPCGDKLTCLGLVSRLCPTSPMWEGVGEEAQAGPGQGQRQLQPWGMRRPPARGQPPGPGWPQPSLPPSLPPLPAPPNHKDFG